MDVKLATVTLHHGCGFQHQLMHSIMQRDRYDTDIH